jgi:hypothetical protein
VARPLPLAFSVVRLPLRIHYRLPGEADMAREVLDILEVAHSVQVDALGFRPPLPDGGLCGPDGAFDVFLWRGYKGSYVDVLGPNDEAPWDDRFAFMVLDAWGPYGGDLLEATVAHELNHACQAADDWSESAFVGEMWLRSRDEQPRDPESWENEPDFEDALDAMLLERGQTCFLDSVVEHARWRWHTGARDDGRHFREGADLLDDASVAVAASIRAEPGLSGFLVDLRPRGEVVDLSEGPALVELTRDGVRTLILTALPAEGSEHDPDDYDDARHLCRRLLGAL